MAPRGGGGDRRFSHSVILDEYQARLRECRVDGVDGRPFYRVQKLKDWMTRGSNTEHMLEDVYAPVDTFTLPISQARLSRENGCALLVFGILLSVGEGALVDSFHRHGLTDSRLPFKKSDLTDLCTDLTPRYPTLRDPGKRNDFVEKFIDSQYAFCPVVLEHKYAKDHRPNVIFPVARDHKIRINDKGGFSSVWQISVLEEFIDSELRQELQSARYDESDGLGPRYRMALKSFDKTKHSFFEAERDAFEALSGQAGMIKYLGEFSETDDQEGRTSYNILLEYGELDLHEFFFDQDKSPPVLPEEIHSFWTELSGVASAMSELHNFRIMRGEVSLEYYGWHADVKPDNILRVDGKFKLADLGFAAFKRISGDGTLRQRVDAQMERREDTISVKGGTVTYGAPECRFWGTQQNDVTRAIDIWSLGCVFSVAATWIVLGQHGILQFQRLREQELCGLKLKEPTVLAGDYFHNGVDVLQIVKDWHRYVRYCRRASDNITGKILDLVDQQMLCQDPRNRITARTLSSRLQVLLSEYSPIATYDLPWDFRQILQGAAERYGCVSHPEPSTVVSNARSSNRFTLVGAPSQTTESIARNVAVPSLTSTAAEYPRTEQEPFAEPLTLPLQEDSHSVESSSHTDRTPTRYLRRTIYPRTTSLIAPLATTMRTHPFNAHHPSVTNSQAYVQIVRHERSTQGVHHSRITTIDEDSTPYKEQRDSDENLSTRQTSAQVSACSSMEYPEYYSARSTSPGKLRAKQRRHTMGN